MKILEVLIEYSNQHLNRPFSYIYNLNKKVEVGFRVLITFNNKEIVGYVINVKNVDLSKEEYEKELGFTLSYINDVLDEERLLNDDLLSLVDKISSYYLASKISVLQAMLPPSLNVRRSSLKAPKIAYDKYLVPISEIEDDLTDKQIEILRLIVREKKVLKKEIKSISIVNKLIELKRIKVINEEKRRLAIPFYPLSKPKELSEEQNKVIKEFNNSNDEVYLLEGVTGSGKTEVYLTLSEQTLKEGKSVLMLVPEISLTPMMNEYFLRRFASNVAILHSELTPAEKYDEYRKIAKGECKIVIGARSAIFAPLNNIGLIILDEEHVESYKQDTPPFYHAREVAIMRGKMHHAKVLLGSATPSLESRARAQNKVYHLLKMSKRINNSTLPNTTIVNLLDYRNIDKESYIFSLALRKEIARVLANNEQAILLINRRGFSSSVSCRKCGYTFHCHTCGIALTYHKEDNMLKCHHCDYVEPLPNNCPECGSPYLMKTGFGSERIEEEVHRLFPYAKTLRLDSDSAKIRTKIPKIIASFANHEADILIGTQMIAKGHDFPLVTLVGIVSADIGLNLPSFRSSERAFELITQAIGRSGRSDKKGVAIIQTYSPSHYAITYAARQDYELFYKKEMQIRKIQDYPPYCYLVSLTCSSKNEDTCIRSIYSIIDILNEELLDKAVVLGPTKPYIPYENGNYIRTLLIKHKNLEAVQIALKKVLDIFMGKSSVNISINIDPYNF